MSSNPLSYKFVGTFFSCAQIDLRKTPERELATTLDEKSTSSKIAGTLCAIKFEGKNRGGEGTTPVTTAVVQKLKSRSVRKKQKNKTKQNKTKQNKQKWLVRVRFGVGVGCGLGRCATLKFTALPRTSIRVVCQCD